MIPQPTRFRNQPRTYEERRWNTKPLQDRKSDGTIVAQTVVKGQRDIATRGLLRNDLLQRHNAKPMLKVTKLTLKILCSTAYNAVVREDSLPWMEASHNGTSSAPVERRSHQGLQPFHVQYKIPHQRLEAQEPALVFGVNLHDGMMRATLSNQDLAALDEPKGKVQARNAMFNHVVQRPPDGSGFER